MATRDVITLNETVGRLEVPQVGDTYRLPANTDVQGDQTIGGAQTVSGTQTVGGTQTVNGAQTVVGNQVNLSSIQLGGVQRNTWPTPGSATVAIDDVLKNGQVSTRRMTLGGYAVSAIHQTLPIASFVDHDFFDNTDDAAWIDRQGHTSWENEVRHVGAQFMAATYANDAAAIAANPSIVSGNLYFNGTNFIEYGTATVRTRGSNRKFPMRGVVTAEANRIIIWSTTGGVAEMWMVFNGAANNYLYTANHVTTVGMSRNTLLFGQATGYGMESVDFTADTGYWYVPNNDSTLNGTIAQRNSAAGFTFIAASSTVIHNTFHDVAITYLPDAPLDEYGMKIPTMPHGTPTGGGWITQDGSVAQLTGAVALISTDIDQRGRTLFASASKLYVFNSVGTATAALTTADYTFDTAGTAGPHISGVISQVSWSKDNILVATSAGLFTIAYNETTPAQSLVTQVSSTANTGWLVGDNLRCFLANSLTADRSVKNGLLAVTGTITETPNAGGVSVYSGFSAANYLSEANHADWNTIGTGDFSFVLSGVKWGTVGTTRMLVNFGNTAASGTLLITLSTTNVVELFMHNGTNIASVLTSSTSLTDSGTHTLVVTRSSGTLSVYIDGVVVGSVAAAYTLTTVGSFLIGYGGPTFQDIWAGGQVARVRLSATALTPEQIAYMYKTEAPLFKTGAQALLSSASNVTDLRYDKKTDQYMVQNGTNTDLFSGLERVASKLTTASDYTASNTAAIEAPAVTSLSGNVLSVPAVDVASELAAMRKQDKYSIIKAIAAVGGVVSLPMGYKPIGCYDVTGAALVRLTSTNTDFDGFIHSIRGLTGTQTYDVTMEAV